MKRENLEALSREVIIALRKKLHSFKHMSLWMPMHRGMKLWLSCLCLNHQNERGNISWFVAS